MQLFYHIFLQLRINNSFNINFDLAMVGLLQNFYQNVFDQKKKN